MKMYNTRLIGYKEFWLINSIRSNILKIAINLIDIPFNGYFFPSSNASIKWKHNQNWSAIESNDNVRKLALECGNENHWICHIIRTNDKWWPLGHSRLRIIINDSKISGWHAITYLRRIITTSNCIKLMLTKYAISYVPSFIQLG